VQFDGSEHDWFEGRGPSCTVLHAIDDASVERFFGLLLLKIPPIPRALYSDYDSV
jgi:hypothetical protein